MGFPLQPTDLFQNINQITSGNSTTSSSPWQTGGNGFCANVPPSQSGLSTRESRIPNNRDGTSTRKLMKFLVPEGPIVELYINPQSIKYNHKKIITKQKTKGGWTLQYYGNDLTTLTINGTTGTSGWEGINVLQDIYLNEQLMFDPYALTLQAEKDKHDQESFSSLLFGNSILGDANNLAVNLKSAQKGYYNNLTQSRNKPTLASLAFTVEMMWSNLVYRGYFSDFSVDEAADHFGLFNYGMTFVVTQQRGFRTNDQAWQKSPSFGQSQSDLNKPHPPYSYGALINPQPASQNQSPTSIIDAFRIY